MSTFEKSNLQPYVSYNETDPDTKKNIEKKILTCLSFIKILKIVNWEGDHKGEGNNWSVFLK